MATQQVFLVRCDCGEAVPLLEQSLLGTVHDGRFQPTDKWPLVFRCQYCGRDFLRWADSVSPKAVVPPVRYLRRSLLWHLKLACDRADCEGAADIFLLRDQEPAEWKAQDVIERAQPKRILCSAGHEISTGSAKSVESLGHI